MEAFLLYHFLFLLPANGEALGGGRTHIAMVATGVHCRQTTFFFGTKKKHCAAPSQEKQDRHYLALNGQDAIGRGYNKHSGEIINAGQSGSFTKLRHYIANNRQESFTLPTMHTEASQSLFQMRVK